MSGLASTPRGIQRAFADGKPPSILGNLQQLDTRSLDILRELLKQAIPHTAADFAALVIIFITVATYLTRGILWDRPDPYHYLWYERPQLKVGNVAVSVAQKATRDIAKKMMETGKDVVVFWGSQSGTAEGFAYRLARELHMRFGKETMAADLSDYNPDSIGLIPQIKLAIFILSTYGEGDPSDNTTELWDWLGQARDVSLSNLQYVAFGLGNHNYKYFNRVVDVVTEALDRFGAKSLMPVGKADDAEGTTGEDFMTWKDDLFHTLREKHGFEESEGKYSPTLSIEEDQSLESIDLHHGEPDNQRGSSKAVSQSSPTRVLRVSDTRELFKNTERHCLYIELDLTETPELVYKTGDHLAIWPSNPDAEVERLIKILGLKDRRSNPIILKSTDPTTKLTIPSPTTIDAVLRYYLEVCAPVNRDTILGVAQFAPTAEAKTQLLKLGQDKALYYDFISRAHLNLGRLLELTCSSLTWSALPLSYVFETLPSMQPRYYSISSSSVVSPRKASITVVVSSDPVPNNPEELVHGVTSNYLLALSHHRGSKPHPYGLSYQLNGPSNVLQDSRVFGHLRRSKFKLPATGKTPLVMVGAGTGAAPFRAFLAERCQLLSIGKPVGEMILFFGCRNPEEDFIYREELEEMKQKLGDRLSIVTAFSRLRGEPRRYVQDRIIESSKDVVKLLDDGGNFYICGRAAMAREVEKALHNPGPPQVDDGRGHIYRGKRWDYLAQLSGKHFSSDRISSLPIVNLECKSRDAGGIKRGSGEPEGFIPTVFVQETAELIGAAVFQNTKIIRRHNDQESFVIGMHGTLFYVSAAYFSAEYIRYLTGPQGAESSFDRYLWVRRSVHYDLKDERDRVQAAKALWALIAYIASGEARI
ncbi:hypothetical protein PVAR5_3380 [Paecilomyces variotii No. 5]|uniref:NADPH--cytochrome P450 reductase n=1 Tax=Byssochlamys spectabilis (strain No. 5 / NBRC 109023) TaxID=1356009 RepID=V5FYC9_BYSSN|nr:hypothetical protein PVAR5_3380 [Paecilomyces variotii No. 5]